MKNNVAIIGGGGFIGSNLTNFLAEKNYNVKVIGRKINLKKFTASKITFFEIDVNNTKDVVEITMDCETVIWLVSSGVPSVHRESLVDDYMTDIQPLVKFLENPKYRPHLKKFVFLSSGGTIYGDPADQIPIKENHEKAPISIYGLSKMISERYIEFLTMGSGFQSFILRPSNVYGVYQNLKKPQGIIGFAFKSILDRSYIDLYSDGNVVRDFLYVSDLCEAIFLCISSNLKKAKTSIYNVGSQEGTTIKEIINKINRIAEQEVLTSVKSPRSFDCNYNVLNNLKIRKDLGWKPNVILDNGLARVWEWIKSQENEE
jgi:UDP-glucose 4-epimerase